VTLAKKPSPGPDAEPQFQRRRYAVRGDGPFVSPARDERGSLTVAHVVLHQGPDHAGPSLPPDSIFLVLTPNVLFAALSFLVLLRIFGRFPRLFLPLSFRSFFQLSSECRPQTNVQIFPCPLLGSLLTMSCWSPRFPSFLVTWALTSPCRYGSSNDESP